MSSSPVEDSVTTYRRLTATYLDAKAALVSGEVESASVYLDEVDRLLASLPAVDPLEAGDAARSAQAAHADLLALALAQRDSLGAELARTHEGRRALRGYRRNH